MLPVIARVFGQATRIQSQFLAAPSTILIRNASSGAKEVYMDAAAAVKDIPSNSLIACGGFGICGVPEILLEALSKTGVKDLTVVSNNGAIKDIGLGILIKNKQVKKMICSYIGENADLEEAYLRGGLEIELNPQGTMIERVRAGAAGIPAFFTRSGYGTYIHKGGFPTKHDASGKPLAHSKPKETHLFNGVEYIMEEAIKADYALIHAWKGDTNGNLVFRKTAQNFNSTMAKCANTTVAEVEELVPCGTLDPDQVHLPGVYVDRLVACAPRYNRLERIALYKSVDPKAPLPKNPKDAQRMRIVRRAALEVVDGMYVNLGIGIPTLLPDYFPKDRTVHIHSENGVIGLGAYPKPYELDADLINAGKETTTVVPGASFFSSVQSFEMVRGGHMDMTFLGAFEVSAHGDLANWIIPGKLVKGMGGAMDLAAAPHTKVVITMEHTSRNGEPRILSECTLPLTGTRCVDMIITDLAVFSVDPEKGLTLMEIAESETVESLATKTGAPFAVSKQLKPMAQI